MKIRTKLALLVSAGIVFTTAASTVIQVFWTVKVLEGWARKQALDAAQAIVLDLEKTLEPDSDEDEISELLKYQQRRHRSVVNLELIFNDEGDAPVSYTLGFQEEEPKIKSTPRPVRMKPAVRRDEIRRALADHGDTLRPPAERPVEPMWRTPDRGDLQWAQLAARLPPPKRPPKIIFVDLRDGPQKQARPIDAEAELTRPRRGLLKVRVSLDFAEGLARDEQIVSATVTGAALLILMLITGYFANRIVGRPVAELADAMQTVGGGDLSPRVAERGSDEIGMLGRGFNAMIERLGVADEEIRAFNRRLADEVASATADLARKNEALGHLNRLLLETRRELGDKERLAALGQLAAQLAHEIGTPLGSVSGHIQLALASRDLPPSVRERLLVATQEVQRVSTIVRDYLDSTRPIKPARVRTDLARLVDEAVGIAQGAGERPGVAIDRRIEAGARILETDPGLLRQILINLLTNAIDAVGGRDAGGGRVTVAVGEAAGTPGQVDIRVVDDGVGIGAEDAARIFEPFYTTKGRGKGTGLGLAICRELAVALGGRLSVESRPGEGSTFTLRLPASAQPTLQRSAS